MTSAKRLFLVLALWGAAAQFAKIATILPILQAHYDETGVASGFLVSLIAFMGIVLGVVAGLLAVRIGPRRLLLAGLFLGAAVSFAQATLPPFPVLMASRFVEGLSHLAIVVAAPTLIARFALPAYQPSALTLWGTFFGVAFFLAALTAPPVMALSGLAGPFIAHGAYMLVFALGMMVALPPVPVDQSGPEASLSLAAIAKRHRAIYASPFIGAPALGWMFYTISFVSLLAVLPSYIDADIRVAAMAWMPIASILTSLTLGVALLRHLSAVTVVTIGFASAAAFALILVAFGVQVWACIALFACLGLVQGASFAAVPQLNDETADRALANGGMAQTGNLGNTLGTPILIAIGGLAGLTGIAVFLIACFLVGIAVHLLLSARRRGMAQN